MTYEEFQKRVASVLGYRSHAPESLEVEWTTGGMTGGNCYGDDPYPAGSESEPEFEALDRVLESLAPSLAFLQYKALLRDVVEREEWRDPGYYGNWSVGERKLVRLPRLHAWLAEKGLLP